MKGKNFDLDRFDQSLVTFMRSLSDDGQMVGIPGGGSFHGLNYNKEVFDQFGIPYPDSDAPMTWTELIDLAREMTREVDGEQYIGLQGGPGAAFGSLAIPLTDPETGDILFENDERFKMYFDLIDDYFNIPGITSPDIAESPFVEAKTAAMVIATNNYFAWGFGSPDPEDVVNIDIAPIPVWEYQPTLTPTQTTWPMVIAEYSDHKEEALEVLNMYYDPEIQTGMAQKMVIQTPLLDEDILKHYGEEMPSYEGKNLNAYFFGESAVAEGKHSNWDQYVDIGEATRKIREDNVDVVTAIRELAEESKGKIQQAQAEE